MLKNTLTFGVICLFLLVSTISIAQEEQIPGRPEPLSLEELFHQYDTGLICTALSITNLEFAEVVSPNNAAYNNELIMMSNQFSKLSGDLLSIIKQDNSKSMNPINIEEFIILKKDTLNTAISFWRQQYNNTIDAIKNGDTTTVKSFQILMIQSLNKCVNWFNRIDIVKTKN